MNSPTDRNRSTSLSPLNELIDRTPTPAQRRARTMSAAHDATRCSYISPVGTRCGSPAMQRNLLCYYHDRYRPKPGYRNLPPLQDAHSLQCAIQEILEDLLAGAIDYRRAALVLYGLQTAAANLKHMQPIAPSEVVTDVDPDAVESPRPPQNVRHGLSRDERDLMRAWFPPEQTAGRGRPASNHAEGGAPPLSERTRGQGGTCESDARYPVEAKG